MMSGFDSTTAKSSMRPPIAAGPISRNLSPLKISTAGFGSAANAATDTNRASSAVFMAANSTRDGGEVARETPSRGVRGEAEGRSVENPRPVFADLFVHRVGGKIDFAGPLHKTVHARNL